MPRTPSKQLFASWILLASCFFRRLGRILFRLSSMCYQGSLRYYTWGPIKQIRRKHDRNADQQELRQALRTFRRRKEEELTFVRRAAGLSAAAVIAAFTWPALEHTYWATSMFWHWSLTSSIFSLISSAQDRLLAEFPNDLPDCSAERAETKEDLEHVLPLVLGCMMFWVWQTPIMLMSYAWALFLMGYFVLILVPLFDGRDVNLTPLTAAITAGICFLFFLHFVMCAWVTMKQVGKLHKYKRRNSIAYKENA